MKLRSILVLAALSALSALSSAEIFTYTADVVPQQVVPGPGSPQGGGYAIITIDTENENSYLDIVIRANNLDGVLTSSGTFYEASLGLGPVGTVGSHVIDLRREVSHSENANSSYNFMYFGNASRTFLESRGITKALLDSGQVFVELSDFVNVNPQARGQFEAVPEPATLAVLGLGAASLIRRRKLQI